VRLSLTVPAYIFFQLPGRKSFILYRVQPCAVRFVFYSRFVWDCKGSIINYSSKIYFKVFLMWLEMNHFNFLYSSRINKSRLAALF
jgi:hypothetical protein